MITEPTALVLGAGASKDFGFPLGRDMTLGLIGALANSGNLLTQLLGQIYGEPHVSEFQKALRLADPHSVDFFLESRPNFIPVGKAAIAGFLMPYEVEARLLSDNRRDPTWYWYLLQHFAKHWDDVAETKLRVITFNYDRTLEHYLYTTLMHRHGKTANEVALALKQLPIVHVYGSLGKLPFQCDGPDDSVLEFGTALSRQAIERAGNSIRIMGERTDDNLELRKANKFLSTSKRIIFLGFGYDSTNLSRLFQYPAVPEQHFAGSGIGVKDREAELVAISLATRQSRYDVLIDSEDHRDDSLLTYLRRRCWLAI